MTRLLENLDACQSRADLAKAYQVARAIALTFKGGDWNAAVGVFKERAEQLGLEWRGK